MIKAISILVLLIVSSLAIQQEYCDVIIAGGSTAAVAAALSSAQQKVNTCLLEPTDWPGGQITSSAVPAIDWAWDTIVDKQTGFVLDVAKAAHDPVNIPPLFYNILHNLTQTGKCWVSTNCFPPTNFLHTGLFPAIQENSKYLKVFYQTVVKSVETTDNQITSLLAIQRTPLSTTQCNGYDIFASQDMPDWYSTEPSKRYTKQLLEFSSGKSSPAIFMDATEYGDILATSQAPYLQGIDERYDGDVSGIGNDTCGQSITVDFVQKYNYNVTNERPNPYPVEYPLHYTLRTYTWEKIWDYRRILSGKDSSENSDPEPGDLCIQNYVGNDFSYGYLFVSKHEAKESVLAGNWSGGINYENLYSAEKLSYGWHYWFKNKTNVANKITLDSSALGTCHGLAKLPYLRDTRRSIGLDKFILNLTDISGIAEQMTGTVFFDRVALGSYDVDIHPLVGCDYPSYMKEYYPILPYFIPLRALTNVKYENLLVAGKTMAQSFLVNSASRLHPVEWSSGTASGVVAGYMANNNLVSTADALQKVADIQEIVHNFTPIVWTINGKQYPSSN